MQTTPEFDVAIVGTGVAGALIGWKLASAGAKVLFLEAGSRFDRSTGVANAFSRPIQGIPHAAYPWSYWAPVERPTQSSYYIQTGPDAFGSNYERVAGGSTWHWLGTSIRLLPADFRMRSTYGVGVDWPIGYEDLEPWYVDAEVAIGVAGDDSDDLGAPRSAGYAMPPIPLTWADRKIAEAVAPLGMKVSPTPAARVSVASGYNGRPQCCGNSFCIPMCPIGAKYDATVHLAMAEQAGAQVITEAVVHHLEADGEGRITSITYRRPDRSDETVSARFVVLAAHGIETPKILLMSATGEYPNGLANSSDQVGRNLMDHPTQLSYALASEPMGSYRSPLSTAGIENLRDVQERGERSSFRIELGNDGWSWPGLDPVSMAKKMIAEGTWGEALFTAIGETNIRAFRMAALCEQLPDPDSRVLVSDVVDDIGVPRPKLDYRIDDYARAGLAEARSTFDRIFEAMGAQQVTHVDAIQGAGHVMGTYRMGSDAATSVCDTYGRTWDHPNLWLAGSGLFPTVGTANPTLTIAALSLRTAEEMKAELGLA